MSGSVSPASATIPGANTSANYTQCILVTTPNGISGARSTLSPAPASNSTSTGICSKISSLIQSIWNTIRRCLFGNFFPKAVPSNTTAPQASSSASLNTSTPLNTAAPQASSSVPISIEVSPEALRKLRELSALFQRQTQPVVPEADLLTAIGAASQMFISSHAEWREADDFFRGLIRSGKDDDILKARESLINLCVSNPSHAAFDLCSSILYGREHREELYSIPVEAALAGIRSTANDRTILESMPDQEAFGIFWRVFSIAPEYSIDAIIQGILLESEKNYPCWALHRLLQVFVDHDFRDLFISHRTLVQSRWRQDSVPLLQALDRLSSCHDSYMRGQAIAMKARLENKFENESSS